MTIVNNHIYMITKPPLGLRPKMFAQEERLQEVCEAIVRYYDARKQIPIEWIEEYNYLISELNL